jgi:hypothetical protein
MSDSDIEKGAHWDGVIADQLNKTDTGVVCLTPENMNRPWILFEAGALAKRVSRGRVCTYLFDIQPQNIPPPLGLFQHTVTTDEDTCKLLLSLNKQLDKPLPEPDVRALFDATWPPVRAKLDAIPPPAQPINTDRSVEEMVAELLDLSRAPTAGPTLDMVLAKLQHIELALFLLSYRSVGRALFDGLAFSVLNVSRKLYFGRGTEQTDAVIKPAWETLKGLVRKSEEDQRGKAESDKHLDASDSRRDPFLGNDRGASEPQE